MQKNMDNAALRQTRRSLPIALLRAREKVMSPIRDMLAASGVNEQKWRVLRVLSESGAMDLTRLANEACLLLSSLHRMIGPLVDDGLIRRSPPSNDRRKVVVSVTEKGEALIRQHSAESAQIFARIEKGFGRDRLEVLLDLLEELQEVDLRTGR